MNKNKSKKLLKKKKNDDKDTDTPIQLFKEVGIAKPKTKHKYKPTNQTWAKALKFNKDHDARKYFKHTHHNNNYHGTEPTAYTNYNHFQGPQL